MRDPDRTCGHSNDVKCTGSNSSLLMEAEQHLGAFHQAVLRLHGPEEAQRAAEDWVRELETTTAYEEPTRWRQLSLAAAGRLAARLVDNKASRGHQRAWRMTRQRTKELLQCVCPCEAR